MTPTPTLRLIAGLIRAFPWRWLAIAVLWSGMWAMPVAAGIIVREFFDTIEGRPGWTVTTAMVAIIAYGLGRVVVMVLSMHIDVHFMFRTGALMQRNMFARILSLPGAQAVDDAPGELITTFREDVEHVSETTSWTVDMAGAAVFTVLALLVLLPIDVRMTLLVLLPLVIVIVLTERAGAIIRRYREAARQATARVTEGIGEVFGAVQSIKVAGAEEPVISHLDRLNDDRRHLMVRDRVLESMLESLFWSTVHVGTGIVLLLAASRLVNGQLTVGEFALFIFLLGMATDVVYIVGLFIARVKQGAVAFGRMAHVLKGAPIRTLVDGVDLELKGELAVLPEAPRTPAGRLERLDIRGLSFLYPGTDNGIHDIDLTLERGSFTVITGRIGSGKTTLLRSLLGLIAPDRGDVTWNDAPVEEPDRFFVPPHAAYTPQVPNLFSMALRDNLLLGLDVPDEELMESIRMAVLEPDLRQMPQGLDTEVGPRGVRLSGGQVQRTAAARMLVRKPDLLVFDDLSSALDVNTEKELWERLLGDDAEVTSLVVSHRLPALRRADQILVLEDGGVIARGTFDELADGSEEFRNLLEGVGAGR